MSLEIIAANITGINQQARECPVCGVEKAIEHFRLFKSGERAIQCRSCNRVRSLQKSIRKKNRVQNANVRDCPKCGRRAVLIKSRRERVCSRCVPKEQCGCGCGQTGKLTHFRGKMILENCIPMEDLAPLTIDQFSVRRGVWDF
jgi:hypothetical protein